MLLMISAITGPQKSPVCAFILEAYCSPLLFYSVSTKDILFKACHVEIVSAVCVKAELLTRSFKNIEDNSKVYNEVYKKQQIREF